MNPVFMQLFNVLETPKQQQDQVLSLHQRSNLHSIVFLDSILKMGMNVMLMKLDQRDREAAGQPPDQQQLTLMALEQIMTDNPTFTPQQVQAKYVEMLTQDDKVKILGKPLGLVEPVPSTMSPTDQTQQPGKGPKK